MAINIKKGTAHTLLQSDSLGLIKTSEAVVAGMVVYIPGAGGDLGKVLKGCSASPSDDKIGFALNDQSDGDVIESGKIGVLSLDGNSVIESDQSAVTINATNYPLGAPVYPTTANTGTFTNVNTVNRVIGYVDGIRALPVVATSGGVSYQTTASFLAIKLAV